MVRRINNVQLDFRSVSSLNVTSDSLLFGDDLDSFEAVVIITAILFGEVPYYTIPIGWHKRTIFAIIDLCKIMSNSRSRSLFSNSQLYIQCVWMNIKYSTRSFGVVNLVCFWGVTGHTTIVPKATTTFCRELLITTATAPTPGIANEWFFPLLSPQSQQIATVIILPGGGGGREKKGKHLLY